MPPHHPWPIRFAREDVSDLGIGDRHGNGRHGLAHPLKDANPSDQNLPIEVEAVPPKTLPTLVMLNSPASEGYSLFLGLQKITEARRINRPCRLRRWQRLSERCRFIFCSFAARGPTNSLMQNWRWASVSLDGRSPGRLRANSRCDPPRWGIALPSSPDTRLPCRHLKTCLYGPIIPVAKGLRTHSTTGDGMMFSPERLLEQAIAPSGQMPRRSISEVHRSWPPFTLHRPPD